MRGRLRKESLTGNCARGYPRDSSGTGRLSSAIACGAFVGSHVRFVARQSHTPVYFVSKPMRILYFDTWYGEIVLCEAPPGTAVFWPWHREMVHNDRRLRPEPLGWKTLGLVKDGGNPRARLICICDEIQNNVEAFKKALRKAWNKLPKSRKVRGVLGVILKGDPTPWKGEVFRNVGFFHVPSWRKWKALHGNAWTRWEDRFGLNSSVAKTMPEGYPVEIRPRARK